MPKTRHRKKPKQPSPLLTAAKASQPAEARQHAEYVPTRFNERGQDGGMMDGMRMEKIACVRALEGLARRHPKARRPFLEPYHLMAANAYHADLMAVRGQRSHALREAIDVSSDVEADLIYRVEARQKLSAVQNHMPPHLKSVLDQILISFPESTLVKIWPNRTERDRAKDQIRDGLTWLAREYGLSS